MVRLTAFLARLRPEGGAGRVRSCLGNSMRPPWKSTGGTPKRVEGSAIVTEPSCTTKKLCFVEAGIETMVAH